MQLFIFMPKVNMGTLTNTQKTNQESLPSQFVICRNLWSRPWRHKLSPITLKTRSGICLCACISVTKYINDVPRKPSWNGPMSMWTCLLYLGVYPRALLTSIWEVVFWTVTNFDSHKLRQIMNPCRRNLWSVAICSPCCAVVNSVQ